MVTSAHAHGHGPLPQPPPAPPAHAYPAHLSAPSLAPPPPAPHGPRRPSHANTARSRTPSPDRSSTTNSTQYYHDDVATAVSRLRVSDSESPESEEEYHEHHPLHRHHEHPHAQYQQQQQHPQEAQQPARPSAKALGKRRAAPVDDSDRTWLSCLSFHFHVLTCVRRSAVRPRRPVLRARERLAAVRRLCRRRLGRRVDEAAVAPPRALRLRRRRGAHAGAPPRGPAQRDRARARPLTRLRARESESLRLRIPPHVDVVVCALAVEYIWFGMEGILFLNSVCPAERP